MELDSLRYWKSDDGGYCRYTLAFMIYCQWDRQHPHKEHGARMPCRRTGTKPLPPRNYSVWPVLERVKL